MKHGRIAMLAWVGLVVPDFVRVPGDMHWEEPSMDPCQSRGKLVTNFRAIGPYRYHNARHKDMDQYSSNTLQNKLRQGFCDRCLATVGGCCGCPIEKFQPIENQCVNSLQKTIRTTNWQRTGGRRGEGAKQAGKRGEEGGKQGKRRG